MIYVSSFPKCLKITSKKSKSKMYGKEMEGILIFKILHTK